jgi:hypothetical protein
MFQSAKGIYLLDRTFALVPLGTDVDDYKEMRITSAVLLKSKNQVRFSTQEGTTLVYDYFVNQWSTFSNQSAVDAVNYNDNYAILQSDGSVLVENNSFTDAGEAVSLRIATSWLNLAGIEAFQRAKRLLILGNYRSAHTLHVRIFNDFDDTTPTCTLTQAIDAGPYEFNIHLSRQKSTSIKIELYDDATGLGESMSLTALKLIVGKLDATNKLANNRKLGTS